MHTCAPSEFLSRWPKGLHPVALPDPPPPLPDDCRRLLTEFGLPRELTIYCYNDITLTFSGTATRLAAIWDRGRGRGYKLGRMPGEWTRFWHLADQEYTQGGGWVCVEEGTGRLVVIDLDLPEPVYLLNSSVRNFYATLAHFLEWSERTGGSPAETVRFRDALRRQDCIPPDELEPFWLNFVDATLDGDPINLVVSLRPK
jgi:SUKH-4 immunity protein